ncbi:hypothetical protein PR202_ga16133 [Eleusine coracana subsp. coracana]|uniref:F-box domain-containing protein n=1 Tax=Eleusine coracana subsp. coracana TaxID=191504 RepID=A0AAV5CKS0_ELECO|nr:hypothetical protein PR202_ga16133 [Eleusine coracana subsp. coracana]
MAPEGGRRRSDKRRSRAARKKQSAPAGPTTVNDVPDDLLERIFLRLSSSAHLVHAAAACKRWCRVVADPVFLRRFRSLRAPLIAGHYTTTPSTPTTTTGRHGHR